MSNDNMNVAIGLSVSTRGEELVDRLNLKVKALEASLRSITTQMQSAAKAASQPTGSKPAQATKANQGRTGSDAKRSAADLYTFRSRLEAQRQRETARNESYLHKVRQSSFRQAERDNAKAMRDRISGEVRVVAEQRKAAQDAARSARDELRSIREKVSFSTRIAAQRAHEDSTASRDRRRADAQETRSIKERISFATRMAAQRQREEAEIARTQDRANREQIRLDRYRLGLRDREDRRLAREAAREDRDRSHDYRSGLGNVRSAASHGRDSYNTLTRTGAAAAIVGTAATASLARRALTAESDIDSAEINSRIYGGLSKDAARQLRDQWAAPLAEDLGVGTAKLLLSYTDALKVGIPAEGARQFAGLATQTSEAWGVPFEGVVDTLGTINSLLTSTGEAFSFDKLKSVANSLQYLAAKQSTTPEKLISFLQRGAGGAQVLGMSQEAGLAFGSASTSLGNQAGESGRLFDYIAGRLVKMPDLVRKKGLEGDRAKQLVRELGYGSVGELDSKRRASPDEFLPDFMERFSKIKNQKKQEQLIQFFAGQEWLGEFGRMVKGIDTYREAAKLAKEAKGLDAIGEVWNLHKLKLAFVYKQITSGFLNIMGEFGKVLSPMARQVGDYFLDWSRKLQGGGLRLRVQAAIEGFISGLGFKDLPDLLKGILGEPGQGDAGAVETWRNTAKAFGEGIRDTINALKGIFTFFTGSTGTPQEIGRWTGRLITFAAACLVAAPAIAVLGGLASGITALAVAALGAFKILKAAGLVGGATAAAGAAGAGSSAGSAAGAATGAGMFSRLLRIFGGAGINTVPAYSKDEADDLTRRLGKFAAERNQAREDSSREWVDPPAKSANENIRKPVEELRDSLDRNTLLQKQNFESQDTFSGLIRKAAFTASDTGRIAKATIQGGGADLKVAVTSGSTGIVGSGGPLSGSTPGSALGSVGIGGRGIIGGGGTSPGAGPGYGGRDPGASAGPQGPLGDRMKAVYTAFRNNGLSHDAAKSFAAEIGRENGYQEKYLYGTHRDPHNGALNAGMMSWQKDRAENLMNHLRSKGLVNPDGSIQKSQKALDAQAEFALNEMKSGALGARGQKALGVLQDPNSTHAQRALTLGDDVIKWRQHDQRYAHHRGIRDRYYSQLGGLTDGSSAANTNTVDSSDSGDVVRRVGALRTVSQECVALAKAAVGVSGSVTGWRKGIGADQGTLKPGTPIATFLNRNGTQSDRYDGGGTGVRGNITTHAGVFNRYLKDNLGKITGMEVVEQFRGSGGPRLKNYMFGQGTGAKDGSNYHAIMGQDGTALGGARNPMSGALTAKSNAEALVGGTTDKGFTSTGWKPLGGGAPLGSDAPISPGRSGQGGGSSSTSVQAPITINGAGQTPDQVANAVQRKLQESMNRRTHDLDPSSVSGIG